MDVKGHVRVDVNQVVVTVDHLVQVHAQDVVETVAVTVKVHVEALAHLDAADVKDVAQVVLMDVLDVRVLVAHHVHLDVVDV